MLAIILLASFATILIQPIHCDVICPYTKNVTENMNFPDDSLVPQIYHPEDQSYYCMWQLFVPDGSYVNLTMYGSMQGDDLYMLEYTYNISIELEAEEQLVQNQPRTFYIPAGINYLILYCALANGGCFNSTIAFSIVYQKLPNVQPTRFLTTGNGLPSIVLTDDELYNTPVTITSLSGSVININIAAENNQNNSLPYNGYIIFAGNRTDGVPLGSVFPWQIMAQLYYNSQITIIKIDNSVKTVILISSNENLNYFAPAPVFYWHSRKTTTYSLTPSFYQPTCVIIYSPNCDPEYITDIKFSGNSTIVSVIGASPTSGFDNMLAQYRKINAADNFPQRVSGMLRTFVVENGQANITTSYNDTAVINSFYTPRPGRKCFLSSMNYLLNSMGSETHTFTNQVNHTHYGFAINTEYTYFDNSGSLVEMVIRHDTNMTRMINQTSQKENNALFSEGDSLVISYNESNTKKSGFYVTIWFTEEAISQSTLNPREFSTQFARSFDILSIFTQLLLALILLA